jgi:hypothetical protein
VSRKSPAAAVERHGRSITERAIHATAPYTPPWFLMGGALPVANLLHEQFGASPWTTVLMTLGDVTLTAVTWESASKRALKTRVHSTVSTMFGTGWLTATAITGMTHPELNLWLLGGGVLAASWNIRRATRNTGSEGEGGDGGLFEKVKLAGIKIRHSKVEPNKVTARLQLPGGELTAEDVQRSKGKIASALSVPANGVRIAENPDHADQVEMTVVPNDILKAGHSYQGPSAPGTTMVEPLVFGIYEDTIEAMIYAAADPRGDRNLAHLIIMGMAGSGKSEGGRSLLAEIATRRECAVWAIDVVKREQAIGCARKLFDWFATSRTQAEAMMDCLPEVISARTDFLASRGLDNWVPGCGLSFLVVWIEEAPSVIRDSDAFTDLVATARSAGVWVVASLQRASHTNMPTDARANMGNTLCFGVRDLTDAGFALPEEVLEAGADPSKWKALKPGYSYVTGPGIPEARFTTPLRTPRFPAPLLTQVIDAYAHLRDELDPVTAMSAGEAYRNRTRGSDPATSAPARAAAAQSASQAQAQDEPADWTPPAPVATQTVTTTPPPAAAATGESGGQDDLIAAMLAAMPADVRAQLPQLELPKSPEPDLFRRAMAALDQELPALDEIEDDDDAEDEIEDSRPKPSRQEALDAVLRRLVELAADGREMVAATDFVDVLEEIDHTRQWMVGELKRLVKVQLLARTEVAGQYRIMRQNFDRELAGAGV